MKCQKEWARRWKADSPPGASEVDKIPSFEAFELLRLTEGKTRYFVCTRRESEEAFQSWVNSDAFQRGHAGADNPHHGKPVASYFEVGLRSEPN